MPENFPLTKFSNLLELLLQAEGVPRSYSECEGCVSELLETYVSGNKFHAIKYLLEFTKMPGANPMVVFFPPEPLASLLNSAGFRFGLEGVVLHSAPPKTLSRRVAKDFINFLFEARRAFEVPGLTLGELLYEGS